MNRNIKLTIAYDGTDFHGWQIQDNARTVQGVIETALEKIHGQSVNLTGSGRTDAGVHAASQIANFFTNIDSIPAEKFVPALNNLLPQDVRILESCEVDNDFHARFSAKVRTYRYQFICRYLLPTENRYNLRLPRFPDINLLNEYGRQLLGEKDCLVFCCAKDNCLVAGKSTNRYIYRSHFFIEGERLIFEISANAFLRNMVRSVAGTFLHYEEAGFPAEKISEIIACKDRTKAGPTLPPQGLYLWNVEY